MKNKWILVPVLSALSIFAACSKSDPSEQPTLPPGPGVDSSKCRLSEIAASYDTALPYHRPNAYFRYDSLKRISYSSLNSMDITYTYEPGKITARGYYNYMVDSNLASRTVYTLDNNERIVSHRVRYYTKPKSENDYRYEDRIDYEYDAEGYVTSSKLYSSGTTLSKESKFSYQNGNLVRRENIYYAGNLSTKIGADTLTYTYDNSPWISECAYLWEVGEYSVIRAGKPNKNNVHSIQCRMNTTQNSFRSIQYFYSMKGPKLERVYMTATTAKGATLNTSLGFKYVCIDSW